MTVTQGLQTLITTITTLKQNTQDQAQFLWATLTNTNPPAIRFDGEQQEITSGVILLAPMATGQRVLVLMWKRRAIVLAGRTPDGEPPTPPTPPGTIAAYAAATPPTGWLACDGTTYQTATYPDLFKAIGYAYGGADTQFKVPNLQTRTIIGAKNGEDALGATGGEKTHTLTTNELPTHNHNLSAQAFLWGSGVNGATSVSGTTAFQGAPQNNNLYTMQATKGWNSTLDAGSNQPHNNMPPYMALNWIIKH